MTYYYECSTCGMSSSTSTPCLYCVTMAKPAPVGLTPKQLAAIKQRHEKAKDDILNNMGAAYSTRIEEDSYSIHADRAALLAHIDAQRDVTVAEVTAYECGVAAARDAVIEECKAVVRSQIKSLEGSITGNILQCLLVDLDALKSTQRSE